MNIFSNSPGCSVISGVRGQNKQIKAGSLPIGKVANYFKIIYVIPKTRHSPAMLDLIGDIKNTERNKQRARSQSVFVEFPEDVSQLEALKQKFFIPKELEQSILRRM